MPFPNGRVEHYPRFSEDEYRRRRADVREVMDREGIDTLVVYGHSEDQRNVHYLTNYWGGHHNYYIFFADPDEAGTLLIGLNNLRQYAHETAVVDDIRYGGAAPDESIAERIEEAGVESVGIVGLDARFGNSLPYGHYATLDAQFDLHDVTRSFGPLFTRHSAEQLEWVERGAAFTDLAMETLVDVAAPGCREYELQAELEAAYRVEGGDTLISFLSSAPMEDAEPGEAFPWKRKASDRRVREGDVITTELSASYWGYGGQIHRPIAVGRPPTEEYLEIYELCLEVYSGIVDAIEPGATARDVHAAIEPLEASAYEIQDVVVHGFGNAYGPPFIGTEDSNYWPGRDEPTTADWVFDEDMVVVVQPSAYTADERTGIQLGNTLVVHENGADPLQEHPMTFHEV